MPAEMTLTTAYGSARAVTGIALDRMSKVLRAIFAGTDNWGRPKLRVGPLFFGDHPWGTKRPLEEESPLVRVAIGEEWMPSREHRNSKVHTNVLQVSQMLKSTKYHGCLFP
jgi:hypothetical protein